jgi:hypothetical protein
MTSINLQTEFLLQFLKQWEDSAPPLGSNRPNNKDKKKTDQQKGKEKLKERRKGKYYEQVVLQEAPPLQDSKQNPGIFL